MIEIPVSYQGGKSRIANKIVGLLWQGPQSCYFDLCCGSGAITIELLRRGAKPENITMVDAGPWGIFWEYICSGTFSLVKLAEELEKIPKDITQVKGYMDVLAKQPANIDTPYVFIILQAASFGSKPIWIEDNKWINCSFRNYWLPKEGCNRKSPVNPMMPMPETIFSRIKEIVESGIFRNVKAICSDVKKVQITQGVVYIDPPYIGTTPYGFDFDVVAFANSIGNLCYVSEGKPLSSKAIQISSGRTKGGINGKKEKKPNEEWLSVFNERVPE